MNRISIAQLVELAGRQRVAVPAELAGCIVLAAADQLLQAPLELAPADLLLFEDGYVRLSGGRESEPAVAERRLRELLGTLLAGVSSVTPALLRAARRQSGGDLSTFVKELEIALVPTNRGASRRALARLSREARLAIDGDPEHSEQAVPVVVSHVPAPEPQAVMPDVLPKIPDLVVPGPVKHEIEATAFGAGDSVCSTLSAPSSSDIVELLDSDVDLIESVQCPPVLLQGDVPCASAGECESVVSEPTAPFPLMHVIAPADSTGTSEVSRPQQLPAGAPTRRYSRVKKPIFAALDIPPEHTEIHVETAVAPGDVIPTATEPAEVVSKSIAQTEQGAENESPGNRQSIVRELKVKSPVVGPHRFVARPCFAKKTSRALERISQFGDANGGNSDQLVDSLHMLATGNKGG